MSTNYTNENRVIRGEISNANGHEFEKDTLNSLLLTIDPNSKFSFSILSDIAAHHEFNNIDLYECKHSNSANYIKKGIKSFQKRKHIYSQNSDYIFNKYISHLENISMKKMDGYNFYTPTSITAKQLKDFKEKYNDNSLKNVCDYLNNILRVITNVVMEYIHKNKEIFLVEQIPKLSVSEIIKHKLSHIEIIETFELIDEIAEYDIETAFIYKIAWHYSCANGLSYEFKQKILKSLRLFVKSENVIDGMEKIFKEK